jgi:hypothetical protein
MEFRELEVKFKRQFGPPGDEEGGKSWDRYQSIIGRMAHDVPCQLRERFRSALAAASP